MKLVYSRVLAAIILGSSMGFAAEATNLEEVFTQGELTGTIGWFGQHIDAKGDTVKQRFFQWLPQCWF